jgi:hypothetical protein
LKKTRQKVYKKKRKSLALIAGHFTQDLNGRQGITLLKIGLDYIATTVERPFPA